MAVHCPMCHSANHLPADVAILGDCGTLTVAGQSLHLPTISLVLVAIGVGVMLAAGLWRRRKVDLLFKESRNQERAFLRPER